ncbi:MAG: DUF1206 domain-containing protein [Actinobacteria bacterium]|nr:DUF1206 domain-containing protein [Actinomycetota bacterium]
MSSGTIAAKGRRAGKSPWVERLGRAGLVAQGVLYGVVGILAIKVALGAREENPDREGALRAIATQPFGKGLLAVLALGFAGYAAWRLAQGLLDRDNEGEGAKGLAKRAAAIARAAWYGALCALTVSKIAGAGGGQGGKEDRATAGVLGLPLGRYIVFALAAGFAAAALFNGYRAVTCKFRKKLETGKMNDAEETAATGLGILGHLARFVVFGLIGAFLAKAAWEFDPKETVGLDGALLEVVQQPYGGFLLGSVAVGLLAYALYCFVQARYRDV